MSFTFTIAAAKAPDRKRLLNRLGYSDWHVEEHFTDEGPWPEGSLHFYRDAVSMRGVEITFEDGTFQVRIVTLCSPEDYELALRFAEAAAAELGKPIEPEDHDAMPVQRLRDRYDANWIDQTNLMGATAIRDMIAAEKHTVTLTGPKLPFHIGPRMLQQLEAAGPTDKLAESMIAKMRELQNIDSSSHFFANVMEANRDGDKDAEDDDNRFTFAVFGPTISYVLPDVGYYALLVSDDDPPIFIESRQIASVLPKGSWHYLDEKQIMLAAIDESTWPQILEKARAIEVQPFV